MLCSVHKQAFFVLIFFILCPTPIWVMEFVDEGASTADCISSKLRNSRRSWRERESCKMICERVQSTKYRVQTCKMICEKRDVVLLLHRSSADTSLCYRATQSSEAFIMHCGTVRWCQIFALSAILVCHRIVYTHYSGVHSSSMPECHMSSTAVYTPPQHSPVTIIQSNPE